MKSSSARAVRKYLKERQHEALLDELSPMLPGQPGSVTELNVRSGIRKFLQWAESESLSVLDYDQVTRWTETLQSAATIKNRLSQVRRLYEALMLIGVAERNPFAQVTGPLNRPQEHRQAYSSEDIAKLLAQADTEETALVLLGALAGLSGQEVCQLAFEQIDLMEGLLKLHNRTLPLEPELARALEKWGKERGNTALFPRLGPVFDLENDHQLRRKVYVLCRRANVPYQAWYALRHHAGLRLLQTTDPKSAEKFLGLHGREALRPLVRMLDMPDRRRKKGQVKPSAEPSTESAGQDAKAGPDQSGEPSSRA